jgi:hypothetical protein
MLSSGYKYKSAWHLRRIMEAKTLIKITVGIAVIAIALSIYAFQVLADTFILFVVSTTASVIEIIMFVLWLFRNEPPIEKIATKVDWIHDFQQNREQEYIGREKIIKTLVKEGIIRNEDIIPLLKHKEFLCIFSYGEGVPKTVTNLYGGGQPLIKMLQQIGFTRVVSNQNLLIAPINSLPVNMKSPKKLNDYIKNKLPLQWSSISETVKGEYPASEYKILEKWRTGEGFDVTYLIWKAPADEFTVDYVNKCSFPPQVVGMISKITDSKTLRRSLKKRAVEIAEILPRVSMNILFENVSPQAIKKLLPHETEIKKDLNIKKFTDFKHFNNDLNPIVSVLARYLPNQSESEYVSIAKEITNKSQ